MIAVTIGATDKLHGTIFFYKTLTADTIPVPKKDTFPPFKKQPLIINDSVIKTFSLQDTAVRDTNSITRQKVDTFNLKFSKDSLAAPVFYHADDSMVMDVPAKKIMLYGKQTTTKYQDNELTAPGITFDQKNNMVTASFKKDSTGKVIASPTFKQKDLLTVSDSISFNMKTGKGLTKGTYTQQGEMYVYGERIKKVDSTAFYAYKARITTCNLDTPHFAFVSKKIKFIQGKFAITGPVHPEFEGVPIPIILPFGIYPLYQGRHSGLIAPAFTSNAQFGLALEGLGYYKVLSDNWDVTLRGTFYSYGGWTMQVAPRYYKRYHYSGNFNIDIQRIKLNFKGDPDYSIRKDFKVMWTHSSDSKARPGVTFSANVNAGTSKFNQNTPNNPIRNFTNVLTSTINYSKVWKDKPFNISILATHSQNTNLKSVSVTLPSLSFNVNTLYPFRKKESAGSLKWYENIGIALNSNALNQTNFYDDTANALHDKRPVLTQIRSNLQWGARHSVPISLSLPSLGAFQVSPGVSYSETWYQKKTLYTWDSTAKKVDTVIRKGFYTARDMSFNLSVATRIFGMFGFNKNSRIIAIRHEIRPQIAFSYKPDLNKNSYYNVQVDTSKNFAQKNYFDNNINPPYSKGKTAGISFGLDNILQMKVKDRKDTSAAATKKISLIDGLGIRSFYDFLKDSINLSPINIDFRTNLFEKINITGSANFDPYQYDTTGKQINRLVWKDKIFSLGHLTSASISLATSFQGGDKKKADQKKKALSQSVNPYTGLPLTDEQEEAAYISNNPAEYTDFSIPWTIQLGYSLGFSPVFSKVTKKYRITTNSNINLNGTLALTPKWQLGFNGTYNFTSKEVGYVSMSVAREMHCWQMSINIAPIGRNKFFSVIISPKSALLRDIKVNRTRYFYDL